MTTTITVVVLIILCICSIAELALALSIILNFRKASLENRAQKSNHPLAEPAPYASDEDKEAMARARKRYEEELSAFQDLMNYNANVAYGIEPSENFKE